jgi:hypothetical protein
MKQSDDTIELTNGRKKVMAQIEYTKRCHNVMTQRNDIKSQQNKKNKKTLMKQIDCTT